MTEFTFLCPHCKEKIKAPPDSAGLTGECPTCGKSFVIPSPPQSTRTLIVKQPSEQPLPILPPVPPTREEVVVKDIRLSFGTVFWLMLQFFAASLLLSVLLFVVVFVIVFFLMAILAGGCAAALTTLAR